MENNLDKATVQHYNKLTVEDVEKVLASMPDNPFDYPKYLGEGIYEISKGCFTGQRGMEEFNKSLTDHIKQWHL
jgi:hypothetical protein